MTDIASAPAAGNAVRPEGQLARTIDRWLYVFMAAWFIAIALTGFLPDSVGKIAAVEAGKRAPFPLILHAHAVLMGAFLLLLLAQTTLVATGRRALHRQLGVAGAVLAAAIIVVGFILVPTMYHLISDAAPSPPAPAQAAMRQTLRTLDNTMLLQIRGGVLFTIFVAIGFAMRKANAGVHKRMMFLAVAAVLSAAFNRFAWLPTTMPGSPLTLDLCMLAAVSPMFVWDIVRSRKVHTAYLIWLPIMLLAAIPVYTLWNTDGWHATAPLLVGAG